MCSIRMVLAAVRQTGQKSNSRRYPQHQERSIFDLIGQFSECVAAEALCSVCDRLAYASRALFYAAHDAIQGVIDELTDVIKAWAVLREVSPRTLDEVAAIGE